MKTNATAFLSVTGFLAFILFSCSSVQVQNNQLTEKEKQDGWISLFDGKSMDGWHLYNKGKVSSAWEVKEEALYCNPQSDSGHGDLISDEMFENFDLTFEWKMPADGNSGVFVNVLEKDSIPAAWFSGPEYQLLGNDHPDYALDTKRAGCLYGFSAQQNAAATKPPEEWNQSRIKQVNGKIEFYLNGALTATEDFKSQAWLDKISESGFKSLPEFGKHTKGHIALQDWAKGISFRNIKIKKL